MDSLADDIDLMEINPLDLYCSSIDTLRGLSIDQTINANSGWSVRPTKMTGVTANNDREEMQLMSRHGIPQSLRCSAWIINVVSSANPDMTKSQCDEFGTFRKVRVIDHGWDLTLKSIFADDSDIKRADVLDFGVGHDHLMNILLHDHGGELLDKGIQSLIKLQHAAKDSLGLEFCPLLPDIMCILLSYQPESFAYATIRQMVANDCSYFLPVSKVQHLSWCKTFSDLMHRLFPQTAAIMQQINALTPGGLEPILKRFFVPLLKREHVLRIFDIFTLEGYHSIFRIGTTLLCLAHAHLGDSCREHCDNAAIFWEGVRLYCYSKHFNFDVFLEHQAYAMKRKSRIKMLERPIFPNQVFVSRLMSSNEAWAEENQSNLPIHEDKRPLGLVDGDPIMLAKHVAGREALARWVPPTLQTTKLELIYSSNVHGRCLETFYARCSCAIHTITLVEVLDTDIVLGMYATQTWIDNKKGYGDGECFIFRLTPDPQKFAYEIQVSQAVSFDDDEEDNIKALDDASQIMISSKDYLSMGIGEGGISGLRLNEDLTRGTSSKRLLTSEGDQQNDEHVDEVFQVGLVETYRFIREVDNKPVDKVDIWRNVFD